MKELFNVNFNLDGSFELSLANGCINVPAQNGCYVFSTGCGTGKTECCKSIIRQQHHQGILYCVDTIAELDKMYNWILSEQQSIGITPDDVMIISSDPRHEIFLRQYQNNPEILMSKRVVLITHVRFWTDLINYFLIYNPQYQVTPFDGDFQSLMSRPDLRKFVMFDETPKFIQPFFKISRAVLPAFVEQDGYGQWQSRPTAEMQHYYHNFVKDAPGDPFPKDNTHINRIKRDVIMNLIPQYCSQWCNSTNKELRITFTPLHLARNQVNTRIMVFEGVGNVLFQGSQYYTLLDIKDKYNCRIRFEQFPFGLKRRDDLNVDAFSQFISLLIGRIEWNQQVGKKTLVVVWKNQGHNSATSTDAKYYEEVKGYLEADAKLWKGMYDVIYYGSAESKSTNQFQDYGEIILVGDWNLTNSETKKFNTHYGVNIDNTHHKLWAFIQLLSRIGIRLHDGQEYSVLYSSDFNPGFITALGNYLINDLVPTNQDQSDWLSVLFDSANIRFNFRDEIRLLIQYDPMIAEHLMRQETYTFSISLTDLFSLKPRDQKKSYKYKALIKTLKKIGITMNIIRA